MEINSKNNVRESFSINLFFFDDLNGSCGHSNSFGLTGRSVALGADASFTSFEFWNKARVASFNCAGMIRRRSRCRSRTFNNQRDSSELTNLSINYRCEICCYFTKFSNKLWALNLITSDKRHSGNVFLASEA